MQIKNIISDYISDLTDLALLAEGELKNLTEEKLSSVGSYIERVNQISLRAKRAVKYVASNILQITKVKKSIDTILNDFNETHEMHVKDFWETWIPKLIDVATSKPKLVSVELKKEFYLERNKAVTAITSLAASASGILKECQKNNISYKEKELHKLKSLTLEIIISSWEMDMNPVTGEVYNNVEK